MRQSLPDEIYIQPIEPKDKKDKTKDQGQAFESDEHIFIGNYAFYQFLQSLDDDDKNFVESFLNTDVRETAVYSPVEDEELDLKIPTFQLSNTIGLSPGQVVALAGDFFAIPDPISFGKTPEEREARFNEALGKLLNTEKNGGQIADVLAHLERDAKECSPHAHWTVKFKKAIKDKVEAGNIEYALDMASEKGLSGFWHSPYFELAVRNFDHFGDDAKVAYSVGHKLALDLAKDANSAHDEQEKRRLLKLAFLTELYGCHFLTDLFAGGHIRTPRKQLLNYITSEDSNQNIHRTPDLDKISNTNLTMAGFFARKMHDDDGDNGVFVHLKNKPQEEWTAYGDGKYWSTRDGIESQENALRVCKIVELALNDVMNTFLGKPENVVLKDMTELEKYLPVPAEGPNQHKPMFFVQGNQLHFKDEANTILYDREHVGLLACRFFNVKLKKANELVTQTTEEVQSLYEQLHDSAAVCAIL